MRNLSRVNRVAILICHQYSMRNYKITTWQSCAQSTSTPIPANCHNFFRNGWNSSKMTFIVWFIDICALFRAIKLVEIMRKMGNYCATRFGVGVFLLLPRLGQSSSSMPQISLIAVPFMCRHHVRIHKCLGRVCVYVWHLNICTLPKTLETFF